MNPFRSVGIAILAGIPTSIAAGQSQALDIWDQPVMSQPFDREPFRPIRVPAWVEETLGVGYTLSNATREQREKAVEAGVTISELGFVDPFYAYYDSALLHKRSPHVSTENLRREIEEYKRLGLRILAVYPPCLQGEVYEAHPDWRRIGTNTTEIPQIDLVKYPHGGMLCLLGPYGDFLVAVLEEILLRFPQVDAFSFDGLHYAGVCYCKHCRDAYRRDTGLEIPESNMQDPQFRRYQHWVGRRMEDLIRRMQRRLKTIKPDVALVTWTTNAGRYGHLREIPRSIPARMNLLLDAPDQEFWMDETNQGNTILPAFTNAYMWAVTNHRVGFSEPYLMSHGNPYGRDSFPAHEMRCRMLLATTYGAQPSLAVGQPPHRQQAAYEVIAQVRRLRPWLIRKRPLRWAALLMSDNTRVFYGRDSSFVEERYLSNVLGMFRALVETHLPVTVINDWNLTETELEGYQVLILPNTACLDVSQLSAVRAFVRRGGGLVASADVSLFDETGNPREDFALGELLGIQYRGIEATVPPQTQPLDVNFAKSISPQYWEKRRGVFDFRYRRRSVVDDERLRELLGDEPVTFKGSVTRVSLRPQAEAIGTVTAREVPGAATMPAVVTHSFGRGRAAYLAAGIDSACYLYAYPYQRQVLHNLVRWAAAEPPQVETTAPMCVHATAFLQHYEAGDRLILQLFNDVNTTGQHALSLDDVPLREEVIPIHDIRITLRDGTWRQAWLEPEHVRVPIEQTGDRLSIVIPELGRHALVAIER